jgi:hypothetical protein
MQPIGPVVAAVGRAQLDRAGRAVGGPGRDVDKITNVLGTRARAELSQATAAAEFRAFRAGNKLEV